MTGLKDGEVLTDHRHVAFVAISKRSTILASSDTVGDEMPDKSSLLNGCLRHAGHGVTILVYRGCVARHKYVGRFRNFHQSANESAPGAVCLCSEHFHDR